MSVCLCEGRCGRCFDVLEVVSAICTDESQWMHSAFAGNK